MCCIAEFAKCKFELELPCSDWSNKKEQMCSKINCSKILNINLVKIQSAVIINLIEQMRAVALHSAFDDEDLSCYGDYDFLELRF